ncbi:MAG: O-antigen ligase family protein [Ignavibacteriales bacterium]|nr:O-antigen ligase family protein [Ignavibacteriales bacterium]
MISDDEISLQCLQAMEQFINSKLTDKSEDLNFSLRIKFLQSRLILIILMESFIALILNRGRFLSFFDPYLPQNFTRLALWRGGWEIFKDYPLFGVGDIGIEKYYVKYKRPYDKEIHGHLHNNYFHFLATLGLFGFLAL